MANLSQQRRSRILPHSELKLEDISRRKHQRSEIGNRCRVIFERIRPQLIENHYNWLIAIDADSQNYLLDQKLEGLLQQVRNQYPRTDADITIFRLNSTGACGKI